MLETVVKENFRKKERDRHNDYKWVYFSEALKNRIAFFLSDKLFGKNLDIGGGTRSYYPGSTIIDISSTAIKHNPEKKKMVFDMDDIANGVELPFADNTFDHATMVSVFQYIEHQKKAVDELQRVLKPGAELYIINMGGNLPELSKHSCHSGTIQQQFDKRGYQTLLENIPFRQDITGCQSVCVAMPGGKLIEESLGTVRNRLQRIEQNKKYSHYKPFTLRIHDDDFDDESRSDDHFSTEYMHRELRKMNKLLPQLSRYPVTQESREYLESLENFTQECIKQTGAIPIMTSMTYNDVEASMLQKDNYSLSIHLTGETTTPGNNTSDALREINKKYDFNYGSCYGHFPKDTVKGIIDFYQMRRREKTYNTYGTGYTIGRLSDTEKHTLVTFLTEIPLNSVTKDLQEQLYPIAKERFPDLDELISMQRVRDYFHLLSPHKQKRTITKLLEIKKQCEIAKKPVVEWKTMDYTTIFPHFSKLLEENDSDHYRGHHSAPDW